jgi:GntR family transcriptional regulator, rspAB operon transcriptional repressor
MNYPRIALHSRIFEALRDRIVYMEYPPGMGLTEKDLCREFKVSRTPLREAFRKLEEMKLVNVIPRFGTYVSTIDINEIRCAFEVKIKLEGLAGELAARRITADRLEELKGLIREADGSSPERGHRGFIELDARFHEIIYSAAQNPILQEFLENLHSRCARLWGSSLSEIIPNQEVIGQLRSVHQALQTRDAKRAGQLMEDHVQYFIDRIKMQLL